ncbi:MAG: proprotein convertase P-domain-containing protein [Bacteroidota bacterium]|nr:proprotein convertase P-domain-containing protein [Bacteroidota bacterium]
MKKSAFIFLLSMSIVLSGFAQKAFHHSPDTVYLPDGVGVSYTTSINVSGYAPGTTITSPFDLVSVCVNMEHSFLGDLVISLTAPDGTTIILQAQGGGGTYLGEPIDESNDSIPGVGYDYCWTPNPMYGTMTQMADSFQNLPAGNYASFEPFSELIGCQVNGTWTITITDNWSIDDGFIFNWGINLFDGMLSCNLIQGRIYADINENAVFDNDDFPMSGIMVKAEPGPYYGISNQQGMYSLWVDSSEYSISQLNISYQWEQSSPLNPDYYTVYVPYSEDIDTISGLDFANISDCYYPQLSVDAMFWWGGLCTETSLRISYENNGNIPSDSTTITVELDDNLIYDHGGNLIAQDGNLLTFDVGYVSPGSSGSFMIYGDYACDPDLLGTTLCVEAHIYPDDVCEPVDSTWDHSSVEVEGECVGDSLICFSITNTGDPGDGDMVGTSEYRLFEDNIIVETGTFQLLGGETMEMCWPATGTTLRLEADQRPGHPGNSEPQESIEQCGNPNNSLGEILDVPLDDQDPFVDVECVEVASSWDPNDKAVLPQGITEHHFIDSTDVLEYRIRFQNTGNAPAETVVVVDTISEFLDITTFEPIASSHPCDIDFPLPNVVRWTFEGINLPDSNANEPESHGFVKFKMHQQPGNQIYTEINNSAAIFFDYNLPVLTNEVFNIIGKMDEVITDVPEINTQQQVDVFPNPAANYVKFSVNADTYDIELYDASGRIIRHIQGITSAEYHMPATNISKGIYYYRIKDKDGVIGAGKLVIAE